MFCCPLNTRSVLRHTLEVHLADLVPGFENSAVGVVLELLQNLIALLQSPERS